MKIIYIYAGLILLSLNILSCTSFLDEIDPMNLSPNSFFTESNHAESALFSIYADLRFIGNSAGSFSSNWQLLEALSGTSTTESAENTNLNNLYALVYDGNNLHINQWWTGLYRVIAQANLVLDNVPNMDNINEDIQMKVIGEAKFLRAWAYFYLVRLWGDIPLILHSQDAGSDNFFPVRSDQRTVYDSIVTDLIEAEKSGLELIKTDGRVSLIAIKSLLAKVYLTMAGYPLDLGQEYYILARNKSEEVIDFANANPDLLGLFPNYSFLRDPMMNNIYENIFMIQFSSKVHGNPFGIFMLPNFKPVATNTNGVGTTVPTVEFYNSFDNSDRRKENRMGFFYSDYFRNGSGELFELDKEYIFKFFNKSAYGKQGSPGSGLNDLNVPNIRFAEILLIFCEATNEVSGPDLVSYEYLKSIKDRAGLDMSAFSFFNKENFREEIWRERWHEFCYEGITWFDMLRLRKGYDAVEDKFVELNGFKHSGSGQTYSERHYLLPLGFQEMENNPNLRPQNPGY